VREEKKEKRAFNPKQEGNHSRRKQKKAKLGSGPQNGGMRKEKGYYNKENLLQLSHPDLRLGRKAPPKKATPPSNLKKRG